MAGICKRFLVSGKVQGVFYRDGTCKKARELNITGWVRNLNNGKVELLACGDPQNIDALEAWLWQGPCAASVEEVNFEDCPYEEHAGFFILCSDLS